MPMSAAIANTGKARGQWLAALITSLLFLTVCLSWGTTWLGIKIAVETVPPLTASGLRFLIAFPLFLSFALIRGDSIFFPRSHLGFFVFVTLGYFSLPYYLLNYGETHVSSGLTALLYLNRDELFDWQRVKAVGVFQPAEDPALRAAAVAYADKLIAHRDQVCVDQWVGKDDRYVYLALGCARFEEAAGAIQTSGDRNFHPTRLRYWGTNILSWEQPDESEYRNSMRRLFPREAEALVNVRLNEEIFRRLGIAKQAATGRLKPTGP